MASPAPLPPPMLVVDGRPVAPVEVAESWWARTRGLLARPCPTGAVWFPRTASVHTAAMGYPIDVACCDGHGVVRSLHQLEPWRLILPRPAISIVVEAGAGSFGRWGLGIGCQLTVTARR